MPRSDDYDDDDRPSRPRRGDVEFPPGVKFAGIVWIGFGVLGLIGAVILFVVVGALAAQVGAGGAPAFCGPVCVALFALVFLMVGIQTVKGTAKSTLGNGIGSIIFGVLYLGSGVLNFVVGAGGAAAAGGGSANIAGGAIYVVLALALFVAGVLALMGKSQYEEWREAQGLARPKRKTSEERDYDDRPRRPRRERDDEDEEDDRPRRPRRDKDDDE